MYTDILQNISYIYSSFTVDIVYVCILPGSRVGLLMMGGLASHHPKWPTEMRVDLSRV